MSNRRLRACLVAGTTAAVLTGCSRSDEAATNHLGFPDGVAPVDQGLTFLEGVGIYVVAPLVLLLLIAGLAWLPMMLRKTRYRPGRGWNASPLWFGGPPDPAAAVEKAQTGDLVRGGASGDW